MGNCLEICFASHRGKSNLLVIQWLNDEIFPRYTIMSSFYDEDAINLYTALSKKEKRMDDYLEISFVKSENLSNLMVVRRLKNRIEIINSFRNEDATNLYDVLIGKRSLKEDSK